MSLSTVWRRLQNRPRRNSKLSSFAACAQVHCYDASRGRTRWRPWWRSSAVRSRRRRMALPSEPMALLCARFSEWLGGTLSARQCQFHFYLLPLLLVHPEHLPRLQFHHPRQEDIGELCDPRVVGVDVVVEKLAAVGDSLLQLRDSILQGQEILVGLELRISFRHNKKRSQSARQQKVCLGLLWNAGRVHRSRARLGHRLQRLPLIVHVALDACHQVGNLIVALLEQNVDISPGTADFVLQAHQSVVHDDRVNGGTRDQQNDDSVGNTWHDHFRGKQLECSVRVGPQTSYDRLEGTRQAAAKAKAGV